MDLLQITAGNPLIITTKEQLQQVIGEMLLKMGVTPKDIKPAEIIDVEKPTRKAQKYLIAKGHRVESAVAFNNLVKQFGVKPTKRGKDNYYKVADLDRIPAKN